MVRSSAFAIARCVARSSEHGLSHHTIPLLLTKANGQPFVPEGFEKQASACLTSHQDTIKLLNHVIIEYGKLKEANDRLTPAIGRANGKTASERRPISFDSPESNAMRRFTELCNAE